MIPHGNLRVGPLQWGLHTELPWGRDAVPTAYRAFYSSEESMEPFRALFSATVSCSPSAQPCPQHEPLFRAGHNWAVWQEGNQFHFCAGYQGRTVPRVTCWTDEDLTKILIGYDPSSTAFPFKYPIDQILSWAALGQCFGCLVHGAAVVKEGKALVLTGRSGAGKTTLSEFCREQGWTVLSDDRVILYKNQGTWYAAGTPWHGSGPFALPVTAPLSEIFLLEQSHKEGITPLDERQVGHRLLDVTSVPWFVESWSQNTLGVVHSLSSEVPVSLFRFTRSPQAAESLHDHVFESESCAA